MPFPTTVHFDNALGFADPHLWVWYDGASGQDDVAASGSDAFGAVFELAARRSGFGFTFKDGPGTSVRWEGVDRRYSPVGTASIGRVGEVWARAGRAFGYAVEPAAAQPHSAAEVLAQVEARRGLQAGSYLPESGGRSGLGATLLADGAVLFGLFHPTAARVFVTGEFNDWQSPAHEQPDPAMFVPLELHRGYGGRANTWLAVSDTAQAGQAYRFVVVGGVPRNERGREQRSTVDPYSRCLGADFGRNESIVVDPAGFTWTDGGWRTPDPGDLVLYELSVSGFTESDPDIDQAARGRFAGITERLQEGYLDRLGVNALSLMPLVEVPSPQGPTSLGYDPSLFLTVERDFGGPDDLRRLVDTAHAHGVAVLVDMVFNHTSNGFNPLWGLVLAGPDDTSGGLYFSGSTPWGNRVATERAEVQSMLIDACRLYLTEYHVDGFRFDATHRYYMDHGFLLRLADELHAAKPDVVLVAENLPNEPDLNRAGYDGYAQWGNLFHDKLKALLREGPFEGDRPTPDRLADAMYFSHGDFAAHTNNVVNYCHSHDENSVAHEVRTSPGLDDPATVDRKGRLGVFATLTALGLPMLYTGQEFNLDQPRNVVTVDWPADLDAHAFFGWTSALVHLRRRHRGLRLTGYDPAGEGRHVWILGPWMDGRHGADRPLLGWLARPDGPDGELLAVLLNLSPYDAPVDLELGRPGRWVKLADLDTVADEPADGSPPAPAGTDLLSGDGRHAAFVLPSSSGFVYRWVAGA